MGFLTALGAFGAYFWESFVIWLKTIFVAPFQNLDMLWILIPVYLGWVFADFFQEKRGTSLGNAISNAVIVLWAGIDWIRTSVDFYTSGIRIPMTELISKLIIAGVVITYGIYIVYLGVKGRVLTKYIGRIREVTYVVIMFTPLFYNTEATVTFQLFFATIIFFPIFYYLVEWLDTLIPDQESIREESGRRQASGGNVSIFSAGQKQSNYPQQSQNPYPNYGNRHL